MLHKCGESIIVFRKQQPFMVRSEPLSVNLKRSHHLRTKAFGCGLNFAEESIHATMHEVRWSIFRPMQAWSEHPPLIGCPVHQLDRLCILRNKTLERYTAQCLW